MWIPLTDTNFKSIRRGVRSRNEGSQGSLQTWCSKPKTNSTSALASASSANHYSTHCANNWIRTTCAQGQYLPQHYSFDAVGQEPTSLKGCVLWNRRAFMVRSMASAKDNWSGRAWSCEECRGEREVEACGSACLRDAAYTSSTTMSHMGVR